MCCPGHHTTQHTTHNTPLLQRSRHHQQQNNRQQTHGCLQGRHPYLPPTLIGARITDPCLECFKDSVLLDLAQSPTPGPKLFKGCLFRTREGSIVAKSHDVVLALQGRWLAFLERLTDRSTRWVALTSKFFDTRSQLCLRSEPRQAISLIDA